MLALSLLGVLEITINGKSLAVASNFVRALLCYLAIEKDRPHRREALAEMFWPEKPNGVARNSLKQAISNLRKGLGDRENTSPYLLVSRDEVQFNQSADYRVDVVEFSEQSASLEEHAHQDLVTCKVCEKHLLRAVELYRGDFLADFCLPDNPDFGDWVILKREVFQRQVLEALSKLALIYESRGELASAVDYSRQLADLVPWNEGNHRNLMRLLALNGMRSAALRQFQICSDCLEKELDVAPSNATVALYEEIKVWEADAFENGTPASIMPGESEQAITPSEDAISKPLPARKLSRGGVIALIIASLILGLGSLHRQGAQYRSLAASTPESQAAPQIQPAKATQPLTPSPIATDGVIAALTALPPPTELPISAATSTPTSASSASIAVENQLQALTALYKQTDGPHWENSEDWLSESPPCEWYGVTCQGEKIIELELTNNQLSGSLPAEIGLLPYLENLDLRNNQLSGNIPPEIGNLSKLKHLYLSGNRELSGPIPPELGNLFNLEDLELAHWESGGSLLNGEIPSEFGKLTKLRSLIISVSLLTGPIPLELCELKDLRFIFLNSNQLSGPLPPEVGKMKNLEILFLDGNDIEGSIPPEIGNLSMLFHLSLGGNQISGEIPHELGSLLRMRALDLYDLDLAGPLPLSLMNLNLRALTFFGTDVCEPPDEDFQAWLDGIADLQSSEIVCTP